MPCITKKMKSILELGKELNKNNNKNLYVSLKYLLEDIYRNESLESSPLFLFLLKKNSKFESDIFIILQPTGKFVLSPIEDAPRKKKSFP